jgi:hypothetical protein
MLWWFLCSFQQRLPRLPAKRMTLIQYYRPAAARQRFEPHKVSKLANVVNTRVCCPVDLEHICASAAQLLGHQSSQGGFAHTAWAGK